MATIAEDIWMEKVADFGCICCFLYHSVRTPCAVHHMLDEGGRRLGHFFTIGLCDPGHHKNPQKGSGKIARHPTKTRFVEAYGTESYLLVALKLAIADKDKRESLC